MNRAHWRLVTQIAVLTTAVAVITAALSFVVSASLIRDTAQRQARTTLEHYATLLADGLAARTTGTPAQRLRAVIPGLRALDRITEITPVWVHADGSVDVAVDVVGPAPARPAPVRPEAKRLAAALPDDVLVDAATGTPAETTVRVGRHDYFVASHALPNRDGSVVLLQPATTASQLSTPLRDRILIALLIGVAVAAIAGFLMARRISRPLRNAAAAAERIGRGDRDVRVEPEGPREVAAVGSSLNAMAEALAASERQQREFFASVSHELRTPLTAITGYAEALADGVIAPQDAPSTGATIAAEAGRLSRVAGDLLDLARLDLASRGMAEFPLEVRDVDLGRLVRAAAQTWASRFTEAGIAAAVEVPNEALLVRTDPARVRQILDGLIDNAVRVAATGTPLVLTARAVPGGADVEVRDGGPGLTDDDLAVAFDRFALHERYRADRKVGTGLGLALIASLAERLGGRVSAGHAPEGGACFTLRLPADFTES